MQPSTDGARLTEPAGGESGRRLPALDGLRGLMTIFVIVSHYFGELPHGVTALMVGWIAVDMYFVLSGFLIGRLIIERKDHANFFSVFYLRRFFRIIPAYIVTILIVVLLLEMLPAAWADADVRFPLWSYLTFTQTFFMIDTGSIGAHWLAPTWTLAVEEHFYLAVPALMVFTPRRWLVPTLLACGVGAVMFRIAVYYFYYGASAEMAALTLLPGRADVLVCGLLAAVAIKNEKIAWPRLDQWVRIAPIVLLVAVYLMKAFGGRLFEIGHPLVIGMACTAFLLCLVRETPEAARFHSKVLRFFGDNGYCLYLTHLPVLGLMHGLILGAKPDLASADQWLVTLAALPVCVLVGWGMTKLIEEPAMAYARRWRWSPERRPAAVRGASRPQLAAD